MSMTLALFPKAACLGWDSSLIWLQAGADLVTLMVYIFFSFFLVRIFFTRPSIRKDAVMSRVYLAQAAFIFCGGLERSMDIAILWWPDYYYLQTIAKWGTTGVTIAAVSFIAKTLIPALTRREARLAHAETQIQALTDDVEEYMKMFHAHRAGAIEQVVELGQYVQEQRVTLNTSLPEVLATLEQRIQALHADLAEA